MAKRTGIVSLLVIVALVLALGAAVVPAGWVRAQSMFSLHSLSVNPQQAHPGQWINISIKVANTWGTPGIYTVVLKIDGQQEEARIVEVDPLSTCPVNFLVKRDVPGTYTVTIERFQSSFTIVGAADSSTGSPVSAPLIVAVVIGIVLIASLVLLFLRRRGFV